MPVLPLELERPEHWTCAALPTPHPGQVRLAEGGLAQGVGVGRVDRVRGRQVESGPVGRLVWGVGCD